MQKEAVLIFTDQWHNPCKEIAIPLSGDMDDELYQVPIGSIFMKVKVIEK